VIRIDVIGQAATEVQRDAAVPEAGWLTHDQDPAHKLGVLRLTGPHFQFRHALLQQRLAEEPVLTAAPTPA